MALGHKYLRGRRDPTIDDDKARQPPCIAETSVCCSFEPGAGQEAKSKVTAPSHAVGDMLTPPPTRKRK